jgi:hypothetical protein
MLERMSRRMAASAALILASFPLAAQQSIPDLTRRSSLIFSGTVEKERASTKGVPADDRTVVVRIDRVLDNPPWIGLLPKEVLTVRKSGLSKGDRRVFFVQPYTLAATIGADVVGVLSADNVDGIARQVTETRRNDAEAALRARVDSAVLIVVGRVVRPPRRLEVRSAPTEHSPDWWGAAVEVAEVLKGGKPADVVDVAFAHNYDATWERAPKLREGEEGILLLQGFSQKDAQKYVHGDFEVPAPPSLVVLDPLDVQPAAARSRIEALLASLRR